MKKSSTTATAVQTPEQRRRDERSAELERETLARLAAARKRLDRREEV